MNRCHVVPERGVPDIDEVIVSAAGQISPVGGPAEATDLLRVVGERRHVMLCHTHIMVVDITRARTTAKKTYGK